MTDRRPNVLFVMTDEERYPPPYETADPVLRAWRDERLPARARIKARGVELHRHYTASTACVPSRASLFTGQYPSLHGVSQTDGIAKAATDPGLSWLDPDGVPTMGDWFRALGYRTFYKGKWHISHADLATGEHQGLASNDRDGRVFADAVDAYLRTDRLGPFGFGGWVGREPHGADPADTGTVRDPIFATQVNELFAQLRDSDDDSPWLAVASLVNPHDVSFSGAGWAMLGMPPVPDSFPSVTEPPSQQDSFATRPSAQRQFRDVWPLALYEQPVDELYRRFYLWLHEVVDACIGDILDGLARSGFEDDTIVVFTSDHGDMIGAHGGMQQKWHTAFDEAIRVPMYVAGPGIPPHATGHDVPTSHVDLIPTLLGLVDADIEATLEAVGRHHIEAHPLVGRDLSPLLQRSEQPTGAAAYFMTEDQITQGLRDKSFITGVEYAPVAAPAKVEAVIAHLPTGIGGSSDLWKLTHYYDRLRDWEHAHGLTGEGSTVDDEWELYRLSEDPEERNNLADSNPEERAALTATLERERENKRLLPRHTNTR